MSRFQEGPDPEGGRHRGVAVLAIDMFNPYRHGGAGKLVDRVGNALPAIEHLIGEAQEREVPLIYVNDNHGDWTSSSEQVVRAALDGRHPELVESIVPTPGKHLFVIKARHSGFFETALGYLLDSMGVGCVVLCGQVTEQCVLYTALDAHVRKLDLVVAVDAVAATDDSLGAAALEMMERNLAARLCEAQDALDVAAAKAKGRGGGGGWS